MLSLVVATALATAPFTPAAETSPPQESATLASFNPVLESIRYRPRRRPRDRDWERERERDYDRGHARGFSQLHAGFYDPTEEETATSILFGARAGTSFEDQLQLGIGVDWSHRGDRATTVISEEPLPGGGTTVRRVELARSSVNLVPVMGFLQFSPNVDAPFKPYLGIGGGWEMLFVSAEEFESGTDYDATFGGWGWQAWGGVTVPLSGHTRLSAEVFWNQAEVERDVDDPELGEVREVVDVDGTGMRFGLNWGF